MSDDVALYMPEHKARRRLDETRDEIIKAMHELVEHADDTVWLTPWETVFERLAYLYEVAGGNRKELVLLWPENFDIDIGVC